jgi:hypothetical protein
VLSQFIEEQGVPTAGISLIRPHTETIKPPRALWVPFELGRPLGPPNNAPFQRRVLITLLELLEAPSGPILVDFPDDEPESSEEPTVLSCPVIYTQAMDETAATDKLEVAFHREMNAMRSWYDISLVKRKRTTVGISGIDLDALGDFIYAAAKGKEPVNPRKDLSLAYTIKFAAEDLKAYYIEGITSQPGQEGASSKTLQNWFWDETKAGEVLLELKKICEASPDKMLNMIGAHFIVPGNITRRKG